MVVKIKAKRSVTTGSIPPTTVAADIGELGVNLVDRKLYVRDGTGAAALIAQGIANYSAALIYALGDLTIEANKLYVCTTAVPVPEPFDLTNWTLLGGGGGGDLTAAVILAPATAGRNRIVPAAAAAEGILIDAPSTQTADLLAIEGTGLSDTGRWAVDALGFSNQRAGAVVWRQPEPTHGFVSRGQPAAFNGTRWVPADASETWGIALALVQEIIDANTLVLRSDGRITGLQTAAFAGGTITPGTVYYVSDAVTGQLTPVEPTVGRRDPVLIATGATTGVVTTGASRNLTEAPPPVAVGPTAPANPELGDLWYRTTAPIGLYVFRDDVSIGEWVASTPSNTFIGDTPPASPVAGTLWFKTIDPVGLYIWYIDIDSSQWVSVGGGGLPPFASIAEALAGTVVDKVMSPATTRALRDQLVTADLTSGIALTTAFAQILTVPFVAEHERMQAFCAVGVAHTGTTATDVSAEFRLRDITVGADVRVISGGESPPTGLGFAVRFPLNMTQTNLVVGNSYELQLWLRRSGGTGGTLTPRDMSIDARISP